MTEQLTKASTARRIIGLTGGIGMGKSTVAAYLETTHQIPVLDADILAREAVALGSPIFQTIVERYGKGILLPDGNLNRARLGETVFRLPAERLWLDQQIHPFVRDRFETILSLPNNQAQPIILLEIPLLFEARMMDLTTEIWVVFCPPEQQIERLLKRSMPISDSANSRTYQLTREQIQNRINAQMDIQKKIDRADVVLDNSQTQMQLFQAIDHCLQ